MNSKYCNLITDIAYCNNINKNLIICSLCICSFILIFNIFCIIIRFYKLKKWKFYNLKKIRYYEIILLIIFLLNILRISYFFLLLFNKNLFYIISFLDELWWITIFFSMHTTIILYKQLLNNVKNVYFNIETENIIFMSKLLIYMFVTIISIFVSSTKYYYEIKDIFLLFSIRKIFLGIYLLIDAYNQFIHIKKIKIFKLIFYISFIIFIVIGLFCIIESIIIIINYYIFLNYINLIIWIIIYEYSLIGIQMIFVLSYSLKDLKKYDYAL